MAGTRIFLMLVFLCAGISAAEGANVSLSQGGTGDALVYGYYNVRGGNAAILTVVNTATTYGIRAGVAFRDAAAGTTFKAFDICLAPAETWISIISMSNGKVLLSKVDEVAVDLGSGAAPFPSAGVELGTADEGFFTVIGKGKITGMITGQTCGTDLSEDAGNVLSGQYDLYIASTGNFFSYGASAIENLYSLPAASPNLNNASSVLSRNSFSAWHILPEYLAGSGTELIVTFPLGVGSSGTLSMYDTAGSLKSTSRFNLSHAVNVLAIGSSTDIFDSVVVYSLPGQYASLGSVRLDFDNAVPAVGFVMHNISGFKTLTPLP